MRAAVLRGVGKPLEITDLEIEPPRRGEVRIRVAASGVCRSDLSVAQGVLRSPLPVVLGHEAAGVVEALGEGVENVAPGDRVVVSLSPECGECPLCREGRPNLCVQMMPGMVNSTMLDGSTRLRAGGEAVYQLCGVASLAEQAVVAARACIRVPDDVPLERACLLGCVYGSASARRDIPRLLALVRSGELRLDPMVSDELPLERAQLALDDLARGIGARHVIVYRGDTP